MPKIGKHLPRGGFRRGAGRKPRYGEAMLRKTIRLPEAWIHKLIREFGSLQTAIETLVKEHLSK